MHGTLPRARACPSREQATLGIGRGEVRCVSGARLAVHRGGVYARCHGRLASNAWISGLPLEMLPTLLACIVRRLRAPSILPPGACSRRKPPSGSHARHARSDIGRIRSQGACERTDL